MATGRRCDLGCESWPDEPIYKKCPTCGEPTKRFSNLTVLSPEEARSKLLHTEFETFYERRCAARGVATDGRLPQHYLDTFKMPA